MSVHTRPGMRACAVVAVITAGLLAAAGCSSGGATATGGSAGSGSLTIAVDNGSPTLQNNFNPFSPNQRSGTPYMY